MQSQAYQKSINNNIPKVSIITVAFNSGDVLERTILSVINQTYRNFEFIVIDGGSTDHTLEILEKYNSKIDYWVSENDYGIYDAMNKGIEASTGKWLNFMNCGDKFYSDDVLSQIFEQDLNENSLIIFGNWEVRYPSGKIRIRYAGSEDKLWKGSQFCHQATFMNADYHRSNLYNSNTKIVGDFEFFYHAKKMNVGFTKLNIIIASIEAEGISDTKRIDVVRSWQKVVGKNWISSTYFKIRILRESIVLTIKNLIK